MTTRSFQMLSEGLGNFLRSVTSPGRYEDLFSMTDAQLAVRGLSRDGLTRSFLSGRAYC
ncbi:hypothetical protein [Pseudoruegeria sp. HB172150]|uniref:hypothetical protein n=1 Tax=Pseudoruegeria sp. HB172150 TaxID=2721164 RepID=UPI001553D97A|nr:hypothetical protein [Pseudoruegeria sp. HB172150]